MLRKFRVSNFKCFEKEFELDLTQIKGYGFNAECVKEGTVNNAIIYGRNSCGKSNLTLAMFDVIAHLTDKEKNQKLYQNYTNAYTDSEEAIFNYTFCFNSKEVLYQYIKSSYTTIVSEQLLIDGTEVISYDRRKSNNATIKLEGTENLNTENINAELSVLKYVKNNSVLADNEINTAFTELFVFVDKMLFFKSLEFNTYLGCYTGAENFLTNIIENQKVAELEQFLNDANVDCKLIVKDDGNGKNIYFDYGKKTLLFKDAASTGTKSLTLFFYWYLKISQKEVSFLMIDEFDAFYHNEAARLLVEKLKNIGMQFILTSHNISLMTNSLLRPDCYFSMNKEKIISFSNSTKKELREAHNIEKMYKAKAFDVD